MNSDKIWTVEQALLLEKDRGCVICKGAGRISNVDLRMMNLPRRFTDQPIKYPSTCEVGCPRCFLLMVEV